MSFAVGVSAWAGKAKGEIENLRKAIILNLFRSVILGSPVKEGRLRGNWVISSGSPDTKTVSVLDPSGEMTVRNVEAFVAGLSPEQNRVFLANSLPYAYAIEYGEYEGPSKSGKILASGFLRQAPEGMVRKNFIRISQNLKKQYG